MNARTSAGTKLSVVAGAVLTLGVIIVGPPSASPAGLSASAGSEVITPISLSEVEILDFGIIAASGGSGTIQVSKTGLRFVSAGSVELVGLQTTHARGEFLASGEPSAAVSFTVPSGSSDLDDGASHTLTLHTFDTVGATGNLDLSGNRTLFVGALLDIPLNAMPGVYSGDYEVSILYD